MAFAEQKNILVHNDKISSQNIECDIWRLEFNICVTRDLKTRRGRALLDESLTKPPLFMKYLRATVRGPISSLVS